VNCRETGDKIHTTLFSTKRAFLLEKEKLLKWMLGSHCTTVKAYHSAFYLKAVLLGKMLLKWMLGSHCTTVKAYHNAFSSILGAYALLWGLSEY
jgi:hypothetical protein